MHSRGVPARDLKATRVTERQLCREVQKGGDGAAAAWVGIVRALRAHIRQQRMVGRFARDYI